MSFIEDDELLDDEEISYWLGFDRMSGINVGVARIKAIHQYFGSLKDAWKASESQLIIEKVITKEMAAGIVEQRQSIDPSALLEACRKADVEPYPYYHPLYSSLLRGISDAPLILYVRGKLHPEHFNYSVAIVGTRKPSSYGRAIAKEFATYLAQRGVVVVSGMAVGIDSFAHHAAIEAGGRTIGVLASGPDICYPASNRPLYEKLMSGAHGAVVSEFFPGTKPEPWHFPARNRIISGLSRGVVVIEAGEESGALITAKIAFEQGHTTFAVPGRIDSPVSIGTNALIRKNEAALVRGPEDVMRELGWESAPGEEGVPSVVQLFGREHEIFELISPEPVHFDLLCQKSGMAPGELSATLTMLELAGIVTRHPGDWYSRSRHATVISSSNMP